MTFVWTSDRRQNSLRAKAVTTKLTSLQEGLFAECDRLGCMECGVFNEEVTESLNVDKRLQKT